MEQSFTEYRLDDATITMLTMHDADVRLTVRDWKDEIHILVFEDVLGVETMGFLNSDLSHGEELSDDGFLNRCCQIHHEETSSDFHCFAFYSAWSDTPILKIVARRFGEASPNVEPVV
jgi:hypothetical protein